MNDVRKGPGDLPGDRNHPNSPDYVEPVFGLDDASGVVAIKLWHDDEVAEIVDDLAEAAPLLRYLANSKNSIPVHLWPSLTYLTQHAERMERMRETEYEILNDDNRQTGPDDH